MSVVNRRCRYFAVAATALVGWWIGAIIGVEGWLSPIAARQTFVAQQRRSRSRCCECAAAAAAAATGGGDVSPSATNSNVVLRTSEDPGAFDSYKIGGARVHRYSRSEGDDPAGGAETEYVMWYHGRTKEMNDDETLPPLSTGRIGRATSRNGLHWIKDVQGSSSEDVTGCSVGLNKDSWWGFDTAHVGLGNVLLPMTTPAIMAEGGVYLMYYMGGSGEEAAIGDFLEQELPESMKGAKIKGMRMKIGVAISQDGITWGRVEGDHPSGACLVPYDRSDPNAQAVAGDGGGEEELYCAWPEVAVDPDAAGTDEAFRMYYSTMTKGDKHKCIAYAVSEDGFRWIKKGICLRPEAGGFDAAGCARCCVLRDATFDEDTGTWEEENSWKMYFEGVSATDGKHRIMLAESKDGVSWNKRGMALDIGSEGGDGSWDCGGVGAPHVVRMDDGSQRMYYTGQGTDGSTAIGVAKRSQGDDAWIREQATFTFA